VIVADEHHLCHKLQHSSFRQTSFPKSSHLDQQWQ
jgi:hypothetical protein